MGQEAQPSRAPDAQGRGEDVCVVDYPGQTVPVVDLATGEIRQAHIFVAVLAASSYTYAEAQWADDLPNWIGGRVRALAFFFIGVPEIIVPDNSSLQRRTKAARFALPATLEDLELAQGDGSNAT